MGVDLKLKYSFNDPVHDSKGSVDIKTSFVICSTPRSGSTLLSKGLHSTAVAGLPHEYFNIDHKSDYYSRWKFENLDEFISLLKTNRVSDNGVFGFKIHFEQFKSEFEGRKMDDFFDNLKYIYIVRKDKILQGISLEKASQTDYWSSDFSENAGKKAQFNYEQIKSRIRKIKLQEEGWTQYFNEFGIKPFIVKYEDLESDYENTLNDVIRFLEIEEAYTIPPVPIKKQRDRTNTLWKYFYLIRQIIKR